MSASRTGLVFVAGLALGAAGAVGVVQWTERPHPIEDIVEVPSPAPAPLPAPLAAMPGAAGSASRPPNSAPIRVAPAGFPPSRPPVAKELTQFDEALARGATSEATAALDKALAKSADWGQVRARVALLPGEELERWLGRHLDAISFHEAAEILVQANRPTAALELLARILEKGDSITSHLARRAIEIGGDRGLALLEGRPSRDDPDVGLAVAEWMLSHGRADEAVRRIVAAASARTPTSAEIDWLGEHDARAAVTAARSLVDRRRGSPAALVVLARALERAGDVAGAFDTLAAALRGGVLPEEGAFDLARLDASRASGVLLKLYGGRGDALATEALALALLRTGRNAEAARELLRSALDDGHSNLDAIVRVDPAASVAALAAEIGAVETVPATQCERLVAYGVALRLAGRRDEAIRALRAAAEKQGRFTGRALLELLVCDAAASREFVEARLQPETANAHARIRILGLLGRRDEAAALFERTPDGIDRWTALAAADPDRAVREMRRSVLEEERVGNEPDDWRVALASTLGDLGRAGEAKAVWDRLSTDSLQDLDVLLRRAAQR